MAPTLKGHSADVVRFFLDTGIVPSLLGFESKERSLPKEESMPVLSVLEQLFYYLLLYTTFAMASGNGYAKTSLPGMKLGVFTIAKATTISQAARNAPGSLRSSSHDDATSRCGRL